MSRVRVPEGVPLPPEWYAQEGDPKWPVGQVVKTAASHAANGSSTLPRVTKLNKRGRAGRRKGKKKEFFIAFFLPTKKAVGIDCDEGPPVPIPNTEVKLICAEDTLRVTARENR